MTDSKTGDRQNVQEREHGINILKVNKLQLLFLGVLSIGFIGYFIFREHWSGIIFGHTAAIGIMGFYGCLAGAVAVWKGYDYWKAFKIGFLLPIILGAISAFWFAPEGDRGLPLTCGGWISLAAGIIVAISYSLLRKSDNQRQEESR
ncbi:hypothetical protein ACFL6O_00515 [candidate division KSB1 bacterium]